MIEYDTVISEYPGGLSYNYAYPTIYFKSSQGLQHLTQGNHTHTHINIIIVLYSFWEQ